MPPDARDIAGYTEHLNEERRFGEHPSMWSGLVRNLLQDLLRRDECAEPLKYMTKTRSDAFSHQLLTDSDNKNVCRLARMLPWLQDVFIRTFHAKEDMRNLNACMGSVLRLRRVAESGMTGGGPVLHRRGRMWCRRVDE